MKKATGLGIFLSVIGLITCILVAMGFFTPVQMCIDYSKNAKWCFGVHWEASEK